MTYSMFIDIYHQVIIFYNQMDFIHHWVQACSSSSFSFIFTFWIYIIEVSFLNKFFMDLYSLISSLVKFYIDLPRWFKFFFDLHCWVKACPRFSFHSLLSSSLSKFLNDLYHLCQACSSSLLIFIIEFKLTQVLYWSSSLSSSLLKFFLIPEILKTITRT